MAATATWFWPPTQQRARVRRAAVSTTQMLLPVWSSHEAYLFNGTTFNAVSLPTAGRDPVAPGLGYAAVAFTGGDAWLFGDSGLLVSSSGPVVPLPAGQCFDAAIQIGGNTYGLATSGNIYELVGTTSVAPVGAGFGALSRCLATDGTSLFTTLPTVPAIGVMDLTSSASS